MLLLAVEPLLLLLAVLPVEPELDFDGLPAGPDEPELDFEEPVLPVEPLELLLLVPPLSAANSIGEYTTVKTAHTTSKAIIEIRFIVTRERV